MSFGTGMISYKYKETIRDIACRLAVARIWIQDEMETVLRKDSCAQQTTQPASWGSTSGGASSEKPERCGGKGL